jgi:hypothetical protein
MVSDLPALREGSGEPGNASIFESDRRRSQFNVRRVTLGRIQVDVVADGVAKPQLNAPNLGALHQSHGEAVFPPARFETRRTVHPRMDKTYAVHSYATWSSSIGILQHRPIIPVDKYSRDCLQARTKRASSLSMIRLTLPLERESKTRTWFAPPMAASNHRNPDHICWLLV